jgi:tetratricopeptide (TPR) repeat protein
MAHWCLKCDKCGTLIESETPVRCAHCKLCLYCSAECQRAHLGEHRADCYSWRVLASTRQGQFVAEDLQQPSSGQKEEEECAICFEPVAGRIEIPGCKHAFCHSCLQEWKQRNPSCPTCRGGLPADATLVLMDEASILSIRANRKPRDSEERVLGLRAAKGKVEEALRLDPLHDQASPWRLFLGETMSSLGEHAEALALVRQDFEDMMITGGSDQRFGAGALGSLRFRQICFMAQCEMRLDDHEAAIALLERCLSETELQQAATAPSNTKPCRQMWSDLAESYYHSAQDDLQRGYAREAVDNKLQRSVIASEGAINMNRHYPGVWKYLALAHEGLGNVDEAIKTLIRAQAYEEPWEPMTRENNEILLADLKRRNPLFCGSRVEVHGLQARPELNGSCGRIVQKLDPASGRYGVTLEGGSSVRIKPANLRPVDLAAASNSTFAPRDRAPDELTLAAQRQEGFLSDVDVLHWAVRVSSRLPGALPEDHFMFGKRKTQYEAGTRIQCPSGTRPEEGLYVDWQGRRAVVTGSRWYDDGDPVYEELRRGRRQEDECIYLKPVYVLEVDGRQSPQFAQIDEVHLSWPDA